MKKWKEVKGMFFFLLPRATKLGTFQWPPSLEPSNGHQTLEPFIGHQARCFPIDHQAQNLPLATKQDASPLTSKHGTFQRPPSLEPSIDHQVRVFPHFFPSPSFKKHKFGSFVFLFGRDFRFEYLETCSYMIPYIIFTIRNLGCECCLILEIRSKFFFFFLWVVVHYFSSHHIFVVQTKEVFACPQTKH